MNQQARGQDRRVSFTGLFVSDLFVKEITHFIMNMLSDERQFSPVSHVIPDQYLTVRRTRAQRKLFFLVPCARRSTCALCASVRHERHGDRP